MGAIDIFGPIAWYDALLHGIPVMGASLFKDITPHRETKLPAQCVSYLNRYPTLRTVSMQPSFVPVRVKDRDYRKYFFYVERSGSDCYYTPTQTFASAVANRKMVLVDYENLEIREFLGEEPIVYGITFDLDFSHDTPRCVKLFEVEEFAREIQGRLGVSPLIWFTGGKGAHIYVPIHGPLKYVKHLSKWGGVEVYGLSKSNVTLPLTPHRMYDTLGALGILVYGSLTLCPEVPIRDTGKQRSPWRPVNPEDLELNVHLLKHYVNYVDSLDLRKLYDRAANLDFPVLDTPPLSAVTAPATTSRISKDQIVEASLKELESLGYAVDYDNKRVFLKDFYRWVPIEEPYYDSPHFRYSMFVVGELITKHGLLCSHTRHNVMLALDSISRHLLGILDHNLRFYILRRFDLNNRSESPDKEINGDIRRIISYNDKHRISLVSLKTYFNVLRSVFGSTEEAVKHLLKRLHVFSYFASLQKGGVISLEELRERLRVIVANCSRYIRVLFESGVIFNPSWAKLNIPEGATGKAVIAILSTLQRNALTEKGITLEQDNKTYMMLTRSYVSNAVGYDISESAFRKAKRFLAKHNVDSIIKEGRDEYYRTFWRVADHVITQDTSKLYYGKLEDVYEFLVLQKKRSFRRLDSLLQSLKIAYHQNPPAFLNAVFVITPKHKPLFYFTLPNEVLRGMGIQLDMFGKCRSPAAA